MLEHRFSKCKTVPGAHSFHCVIASEYGLSFSKLSGEPSLYPLSVQRKGNEISIDDVPVAKFLHPNGPSVYFHWPQLRINARCW